MYSRKLMTRVLAGLVGFAWIGFHAAEADAQYVVLRPPVVYPAPVVPAVPVYSVARPVIAPAPVAVTSYAAPVVTTYYRRPRFRRAYYPAAVPVVAPVPVAPVPVAPIPVAPVIVPRRVYLPAW